MTISVKRQYEGLYPDVIVGHSFWKGEDPEVFKGLFANYHNASDFERIFEKYFEILSMEEYKEF